jgi:hypothetical protein
MIKRLLVGAERVTASVKRSSFPVRLCDLQKLLSANVVVSPDDLCTYAAARLAYCLASRPGNVALSDKEDVSKILLVKHLKFVDSPMHCLVDLGPTKTSSTRSIRQVFSTETVATLEVWLRFHPDAKNPESPLFLLPSSLSPLSTNLLKVRVRSWLVDLGVDWSLFTGVSFRAGAASDLSDRGFSVDVIKKIGAWRSNAYQRYVRPRSDGQVDPFVHSALQSL